MNGARPGMSTPRAGAATPAAHPAPQTHSPIARGTPAGPPHPERAGPLEHDGRPRGETEANRPAVMQGAQRLPAPVSQAHFNEHVRDPAREHQLAAVHEHDFHTRDVRRFDAQEREHWRGGRWHNDWHYGRFGWWYQVDDVWYAYPAPIFPYPLVVQPIVVEEAVGPVPDDPPPPALGIGPLPALPKAAYHCGNPEGFFPSVEACNADWMPLGAH